MRPHWLTHAPAAAAALGLTLFGSSCSSGGDDEITSWRGSEYHLAIKGTVNGEKLDIDLSGADAQDAMKLYCELEWVTPPTVVGGADPDLTMAVHREIKILAEVEINGETRYLSLEHKDNNFQDAGEGSTFTIVPRSETEPPGAEEAFFEWEYTDGIDGDETYESSANSGFMTLEYFEGTTMADSMVFEDGTSSAGMYVDASWSASERITMSFSAPCAAFDIDVE